MTVRRTSINPNLFRGPEAVVEPEKPPDEAAASGGPDAPSETPQQLPANTRKRGPSRQASERQPAQAQPPEPQHQVAEDQHPITRATDPLANLTLRVRRPLDDRLADVERLLTRQLRDDGDTPTSKTELVELMLWELPPVPTELLRERLNAFRERAGRR